MSCAYWGGIMDGKVEAHAHMAAMLHCVSAQAPFAQQHMVKGCP